MPDAKSTTRKNTVTQNDANNTMIQTNPENNEIILNISATSGAITQAKMEEIKLALIGLATNSAQRLTIQNKQMIPEQAQQILALLNGQELALFTMEINLPRHLTDTRVQIEFDNIISNHRIEKNRNNLVQADSTADETNITDTGAQPSKKRTLPKGKIKPKIEITLHEEITVDNATDSSDALKDEPRTNLRQITTKELERSPIAAQFVSEILAQPKNKAIKTTWEAITNRKDAQTFRTNFIDLLDTNANLETHPIQQLLHNKPELKTALNTWTRELSLGKKQYDALIDVYGQYGHLGLEKLFKTWEYDNEPFKQDAFKKTHALLLKNMPSYLPFIEDNAFNEVISKISTLSEAKRSWWMALIKNHSEIHHYTDLPTLYKKFVDDTVIMEEMGLTFYPIDSLRDKRDLPSILADMITLIQKCPEHDRAVQWACMHAIDLKQQNNEHFIIPEMDQGIKQPIATLDEFKALIQINPSMNPQDIKPALYRYLATRKRHLPLQQYREILDDIFSYPDKGKEPLLNNEIKLRMAYVLAKTTSSDIVEGFDTQKVLEEWNIFKNRTIHLEYMKRIAKNMATSESFIYTFVRRIDIRIKVLAPIMQMPIIPPMSYLNKLITLSEYKYLNPQYTSTFDLPKMDAIDKEMPAKMNEAAVLYNTYPDIMVQAIRLIKTDTIEKNASGKYHPPAEDINLFEKFISTCKILTDRKYNNEQRIADKKNQPIATLLPLLTTFHLEYSTPEELVGLIEQYTKRINTNTDPDIQEKVLHLLPYALSLLQKIKNRNQPYKLTIATLNDIQSVVLNGIQNKSLSSKKQVRTKMDEIYGKLFNENELRDIRDDVNFDTLFDTNHCDQPEIRRSIEQIVSNFDNDEEKESQAALAADLLDMTKVLNPEQNTRFFEYCQEAFKTGGLLSRDKQNTSPSYIKQFNDLVTILTNLKSTTEFDRYMSTVSESVMKNGSDQDSIAKCCYLLNTLFPFLIEQGIDRKEAFNFAAKIICNRQLSDLHISHGEVNYQTPEKISTRFIADLDQQVEQFRTDANRRTQNDLLQLRTTIEAINAASAINPPFFEKYREILDIIADVNQKIEERTAANQKRTGVTKFFDKLTFKDTYRAIVSEDEYNKLFDEGLSNLTSGTLNQINTYNREISTRFQDVVTHLYHKKTELLKKYNNIAIRTNDFIDNALALSSPQDVGETHNVICQLIDDLLAIDDQNLVMSIMYHYSGGMEHRGLKDLIDLFNTEDYKTLEPNLKKDFISVIMTQMNNGTPLFPEKQKGQSDEDYKKQYEKLSLGFNDERGVIKYFLKFISTNKNNKIIMSCMHDYYQHAPYPPITKFILWTKNFNNRKAIDDLYKKFDLNPSAITPDHNGREEENEFKITQAEKIIEKMPEVQDIFQKDDLHEIKNHQRKVRLLSTQEILTELKIFKDNPPKDHIRMVTLTAELLHRCKGNPPIFVGKEQIGGRSYELNTTQLLAVLAMLESGNRVTAEIGTGEGKTRILMLLNACQFLKGNTVDFLTSNLALAERDYLEALPFYQSLGAEVNFITATSKIEDYKIGGINISDPPNLFLFREKAINIDQADKVLDPHPEKRAISLDEADVTFFDVSNTKYNFSSKTPKINIDLLPVYPLLMEFFAESANEETYGNDKQRCNELLLHYIEDRNPKLYQIVRKLSKNHLEKLQDAAYTARHLEYNIDYSIVTEATTPTALGERKVAAAMCLIGSRVNENARFSDGVHACLHAELNRLMKAPSQENEHDYLKEALNKCKAKGRVFNIEPQRQLMATTSSDAMLQCYKKGSLMAVTGTIGSELEKREAKSHFKTKFVHIPPHKTKRRYDRPIVICETNEKYMQAFIKSILDASARNEPTLIICKDDNDSRALHDALERHLKSKPSKTTLPKITRIHAATDYEDEIREAAYINNVAGMPGQVTISTDMQGRGVDIKPGPAGLRVLHAYLPPIERNYIQGVGRSGRFGAIGNTQMILNVEMLKRDFGINYLNADFYLNPETFIKRLQVFATFTKELHRLFHKTFDDRLTEYTKLYEKFKPAGDQSAEAWSHFISQYNISQENAQQAIEVQLQERTPSIKLIEEKLQEHSQKVNGLWKNFIDTLPEDQTASFEENLIEPTLKKPELLAQWLDDMRDLEAQGTTHVEVEEIRHVKIHEQYDSATAGRLNILKDPSHFSPNIKAWLKNQGSLFPHLKSWFKNDLSIFNIFANFRAWRRGEGLLFPNLLAWWTGNLSFRNMVSQWPIIRLFITPKEETHIVKIKVPSTFSTLYKKYPELMDKNDEAADLESDVDPSPLPTPPQEPTADAGAEEAEPEAGANAEVSNTEKPAEDPKTSPDANTPRKS